MYGLIPKPITEAMLGAGTTIAEPAAGEIAWVSGGTHAVGDLRIRSTTHRVYKCSVAHTGRTALPEVDTSYWTDYAPTQRHAPFDIYTSTAAVSVTSLTYVLTPGYFNSLSLYGLVGWEIAITIKDAPGGAVIYSHAQILRAPASGYYAYLFVPRRALTKLVLHDLPIRPTAELTITVTAAIGEPVSIGMLNVGDLQPLVGGDADWGGTDYGPSVEPVTNSYIKFGFDGTLDIKRRPKATNLSLTVTMPRTSADASVELLQNVLDVPISWIGSLLPGYDSLNAFGLGSGRMVYQDHTTAKFNIQVKGII